ncbi:GNAT family N-acetyltransferase [Ferdinandcohnia sp. Marseille-Q9671]
MSVIVTPEVAQVLETSEIEMLRSRLTAIQAMDGNPMGIAIKDIGSATAFSAKNIPGPSFNTIKGLSAGDEEYIDQMIDFYNQNRIPVRFEISPGQASPDLLTYLSEQGFYQRDFHTTLYLDLSQIQDNHFDETISIRELQKNEFDLFADIYTKGFQMPAFLKESIAKNNQILYGHENWIFYLASVEKEPAGVGVLYSKNGIATLAAATTLPEYRNRGIQSAIIKNRMLKALEQDCKLLVGQARFGSVSQNNMERAGMKIAYTKSIWVKK